MFNDSRGNRGFTLIEVTIAVAILSVVILAFTVLITIMGKGLIKTDTQIKSTAMGHQFLVYLEEDLNKANEIVVARPDEIVFIADWNTSPNYNPDALSVHGIPNKLDPDVDGDAGIVMIPSQQWRVGYNLQDDDDDNDGKVDMQFRISVANGILYREIKINQARDNGLGVGWTQRKALATNILSTGTFTYWGSKESAPGNLLDLGADQAPNTFDAGENDGFIDFNEMDVGANGKPNDGDAGEKDGVLDQPLELGLITRIHVHVDFNFSADPTKSDYSLTTDISPPLLPLKAASKI